MASGAIYNTEGKAFLAIYMNHSDIYSMLPEELSNFNHVAHFSYQKENQSKGIDIFEITNNSDLRKHVGIKKEITINEDKVKIFDFDKRRTATLNPDTNLIQNKYSAGGQIINGFSEIIPLAFTDILYHCQNKISKGEKGLVKKVSSIEPQTQIRRINPKDILKPGKKEYIKHCLLEANIDFVGDCLTNWIPGENSSFDGNVFKNYFYLVGGHCNVCYAESNHGDFPKEIHNHDKKQLIFELNGGFKFKKGSDEVLGRPVKVLRFGKVTEPWTPYTKELFVETLEAMVETGTRGVIATKFLPFDSEIANLLKKTNSVPIYSIDGLHQNRFELGALKRGSTNNWRIEQSIKYKEQGVDSMFYLLGNFYLPPQENQLKILNIAKNNSLVVQLLPIRYSKKSVAEEMTGIHWNLLQEKSETFEEYAHPAIGKYISDKKTLLLEFFHPKWSKLIGKNKGYIKMCHHDDKHVYCGTCSYNPGFITKNNNHSPKAKTKKKSKKKKTIKGMDSLFD